ncbi:MAG TPA: helix-turn-helix domain-containing protein [Solirubrobacterales bacterium]|nr:helix-turn-helix domain-containing protein [Solirubrobacterales bacterium]
MFANLGRTLGLLRELRGKSQARVAREAGIGKSQLSKYENGKELPKLDSLEKVLNALGVGHFEFFYTLYLVDERAAGLARADSAAAPPPGDGREAESGPRLIAGGGDAERPLVPPLFKIHPLLSESTDQAFSRVFSDLLLLYRRVFEQLVFAGEDGREAAEAANTAKLPV